MLYLKSLHIIFVVTWFAGLFYIVRLFIYHQEADAKDPQERDILQKQFLIMQRRLWYGITWPSAILTGLFGFSLIHNFFPLTHEPWLIVKLVFVFFLYLYHFWCGRIFKQMRQGQCTWTSTKLRFFNEVATVFLVSIIFLVELKELVSLLYGLLGLLLFSAMLMSGIYFAKKRREQKTL